MTETHDTVLPTGATMGDPQTMQTLCKKFGGFRWLALAGIRVRDMAQRRALRRWLRGRDFDTLLICWDPSEPERAECLAQMVERVCGRDLRVVRVHHSADVGYFRVVQGPW